MRANTWPGWLFVGRRSLLFGAHQFFLHPLCLGIAWNELYGFPRDPRLWCAFLVHDWGYWEVGVNMDQEEGRRHPERGAKIMGIFGKSWHDLCLYHSRFYCKRYGHTPSPLCWADKLAATKLPKPLYLAMVRASGEITEYRYGVADYAHFHAGHQGESDGQWYDRLVEVFRTQARERR